MQDDVVVAALLSSPSTILVGASADGTITHWSQGAAALYGWTESEIVGQHLSVLVPPDRPDDLAERDRLMAGAATGAPMETVRVAKDGALLPVELHLAVVRDEQGAPAGTLALHRDLRRAERAEAALRASEQDRDAAFAERFDVLLRGLPVSVVSYDVAGRCTSCRGQGLRALGLAEDELDGSLLLEHFGSDAAIVHGLRRTLSGESETAAVDLAGRVLDCYFHPHHSGEGAVVGGVLVALDITARATAERDVRRSEARMQALLRNAADVVWVVDRPGRLLWVSPAVERVLGYEPASLFWRPVLDLVHPDDVPEVVDARKRVLAGQPMAGFQTGRLYRADGTVRWFDYSYTNLLDDPDISGLVVNLRDVTERRAAEHELQRLALHDPLTGLANRLLLLDRIGQALAWGRQNGTETGLITLDVCGLTGLNERLGHEVGDDLLRAVADRLSSAARPTDSVARVGGGTFAVLVEDVGSAEELRARVADLLDVVQAQVDLDGSEIQPRIRAGSALSPASDAGTLLSAAERSLPTTAGSAPSLVVAAVTDAADGDAAVHELRRAVEGGQLRLHFQPVMDLATGSMAGAEALVRWQHPERGLLPPKEFIPLAESSGLIEQVGEWVLRDACAQARRWQDQGRTFGIGINLSPRQMVGPDFAELVRRILQETGARADRLVLEVTESAVMDGPDAVDVLHALRGLGLRLALDDFGTGYSSLTYLRRFPIDAIKIDRSFVSGLGRGDDDDAVVASIVSLGHAVGKLLVAEGIETPAQLSALRAMGAQQGQGFLWSPALPPDELIGWLEEHERQPAPTPVLQAVRVRGPHAPSGQAVERILALHDEGASLHTIAAALNAEGLRTAAGPRWTTTTVARVISGRA